MSEHTLKPRILRMEITEENAGKTIKEYLMRQIGFSSAQLSRFKYRKDGIVLNGERRYVSAPLQAGDVLEIRLTGGSEPVEGRGGEDRLQKIWVKPVEWLSRDYPLRILYEDEDILAADKPSGIVCHPSPGHFDDTLSNQVADHLGRIGQELDVRVTGRLDKDTSGIVIFALNTEAAAQLIKQRGQDLLSKLYIARVRGRFPDRKSGIVDRPLRREDPSSFRMVTAEDGKPARTHYRVLQELPDGTTLIACRIEHGRTHQIRVHMASIGHPLVGDRLYGTEADPDPDLYIRHYDGTRRPGAPASRPESREDTGGPVPDRQSFRPESRKDTGGPVPDKQSFRPESREDRDLPAPEKQDACLQIRGENNIRPRREEEPERPAVPLMLHAFRAGFRQPFTGRQIRLEAPLPAWASGEGIRIETILREENILF